MGFSLSFISLLYAGQIGSLPSDAADRIASMQKAIDELSATVSSVSLRVQTSVGHGSRVNKGYMQGFTKAFQRVVYTV